MKPGVGVGVIIKKDNLVLFQKRTGAHGQGTWSVPGGHMEFGETPLQTAARETKEEVNIDICKSKVIAVTNDIMTDEQKHYITIFVEAEYAGGDLRIMEPDKITEILWRPLDKPPQPLFKPLENFFGKNRIL